jgi:uncharacterized protein
MEPSSLGFYAILFITGVGAGFVDSIAGGGGLITLPVLLSTGMLPHDALGTNKLQAMFGSGSATWHFTQAGLVRARDCLHGILFTGLGAAGGTYLVLQLVNSKALKLIIPWFLIAIAVYLLVKPAFGDQQSEPRVSRNAFHIAFGLLIGFYDGIFGPGTGTFWAMAYVMFLGFDLTQATAHTKLMNFTSNIVSVSLFAFAGHVLLWPGVVMGTGQLLGARLGSRAVIQRGTKIIRPLFLVVVVAISVKLLWDYFRKA